MARWTYRTLRQFAWITVTAGYSGLAALAGDAGIPLQDQNAGQSDANQAVYLPYAQFNIPFNLDQVGTQPSSVHLYVSTDQGASWQLHGRSAPTSKHFEFRAAAEGEYLFTVHTMDSAGVSFPSPSPPLRVLVDTTKPQATIQADLDHNGSLIVDLKVWDLNLNPQSALLRVRTEKDSGWREVPVEHLVPNGDRYEGQIELVLPSCREVLIVFSVMDLAKNATEASFRYSMPRTAVGPSDMQLASTRPGANLPGTNLAEANLPGANPAGANSPGDSLPGDSLPGAVSWDPDSERKFMDRYRSANATGSQFTAPGGPHRTETVGAYPTAPMQGTHQGTSMGPGKLAGNQSALLLDPVPHSSRPKNVDIEEIPAPELMPSPVVQESNDLALHGSAERNHQLDSSIEKQAAELGIPLEEPVLTEQPSGPLNPYFCKTRTFSLDYSADALGGTLLSEVELWGTEDQGQNWQKWGTDPDRTSPFDVRVGNDGLFGFRMVIVGQDGQVVGQPKSGDTADVWIYVDSEAPTCKITRAVYGEGSDKGMLVIDYHCIDSQLADQPISLYYSTHRDGPWTEFASGIKNTGLYLWKVDPNVPNQVFLKLEVVDKAGNTAEHRMDLPIDIRGLAPRGRIQGFRPIVVP